MSSIPSSNCATTSSSPSSSITTLAGVVTEGGDGKKRKRNSKSQNKPTQTETLPLNGETDGTKKRKKRQKSTSLPNTITSQPSPSPLVTPSSDTSTQEITVDSRKEAASVLEGLEVGYITCDLDKRFALLHTLLRRNGKQKIIAIFSSSAAVSYFSEILINLDVEGVFSLLASQGQSEKEAASLLEFNNASHGILLSTEIAIRGSNIPDIDWMVQFDPPADFKEHIDRLSRIPRGTNTRAKVLHILLPTEQQFVPYFNELVGIKLDMFQCPKLDNIQSKVEKLVATVHYLNISARLAYKGYLKAYGGHQLKDIYDVYKIELPKVAKCLGLDVVPRIDLKAISNPPVDSVATDLKKTRLPPRRNSRKIDRRKPSKKKHSR